MHEVALALFWHQHQPYYPDDVGQENPMPWVRLHGVKDYWGMAMLLKEIPEMRATINLVPSLIKQLQAYTHEGHQDTHLRISRTPADSLSEEDFHWMLDNFFMVHPDHMIRPYPRYFELYKKRGFFVDPPERARKRFSKRDIIDLQVWSNLVWFHPLAFERDSDLAEFRAKGRLYTEAEKQWLLDKQMEILREVIPLHKELEDRGQIELTTTPFYHPIVPLLLDKRLARRAMPEVFLPQYLDGYPEDAAEHIRRAVQFHEKVFGRRPRGMWPSEGSVCQAMIPLVADAGIWWIATDEEILSCSTDGWISRDFNGYHRNPEMLYRPWRVEEAGRQLQVVFRDHAMSDLIGFHYQRCSAEEAVGDFIGKVEAIGRATGGNAGHRPTLLPIILDGENCWEYYPNQGVDFLRLLYRRVVAHPKITPVRIEDYLQRYPATDKLNHLFPGSWIQHNFGIWIGHPECNRAWDLLYETRRFLVERSRTGKVPEEKLRCAWEELYIAEGSDWFWWFGDSHSCAQDGLFDRLFRKHLQNVYVALGETPPPELSQPIKLGRKVEAHTQPTSLLNVKVDGRQTYFEWINAGRYVSRGSRGAMSLASEGLVDSIYFGFGTDRFCLRIDSRGGPVRERFAQVDLIRIIFVEPKDVEIILSDLDQRRPTATLVRGKTTQGECQVEAAADQILEVALPLRALGANTGDPVHFYVELKHRQRAVERVPTEGAIETSVPPPEFELIMWQA